MPRNYCVSLKFDMSETKRVYNLVIDGSVVFGPADTFPKVSEFHAIIVANRSRLTRDSLAAVAYQTACQAPHKFISLYLNKLICIFWSDETSALTQLADSAAGSKVCGRIFKRGEIVWTCKQCGLDPTCVQCDQCYRSSDHIGHDVYFHKSGAGGGCCDCGDSEAWKAEGNCPHHGEKSAAGKDSSKIEDPITELPEPLVEGASAVLLGTVLMLVNFTIMSVRGFEPFDKNVYVAKASDESLCLRLFNDDFHSYIEVNEALRQCGLSESACNSTTRLVDKTGFAKISSETFDKLRPIYEKLRPQLHLLVSIVPDSLVTMEPTINSLLNWFQELAAFHDGLRRIVANILITRIDQIAPSAVDAIRACSYIDGVRCAFLDPFDDVMTFRQQFPLIVPVVDCRTTPRGRQPPLVFESSDIISLGSNVLTKHPEICVPMAVLVAASHFLTQPLQKSLNELLIGGLRDEIFRRAFTQVLTMLYPTLHKQFCVGLGTAERSVLQDTCQVYTAYSLSMMMSSVGLAQRVLQPAEASSNPPIHISTVLMQSAVQCIRLGGIAQSTCSNTVVKGYEHSHVLSHHRFRQSLRDFGYVMKCPGFGLGVLCGDLDPETVDVFLIYCKELSGMDGYKCIRSGAHIEQEDVNWQSAVEVALELENTSTEFLDDAFFPQHIQNLTETALILKKKEALKFLVTKTIAVLHERWENDCLRMTKFFDGQSLISTGPSTAVSARMVSIHNTLEKFLAKCIVTAARSGLIFSLRDFNGVFGFMLAEAALRSFSFVAQVKGQIWIRNGIAPFNIAHNYDFPPVCLMFRDVDLHVLQIALHEYKNKDVFLSTVRCIFELTQNPFGDLNAEQFSSVSVFTENSCIHLASELLRMLILLMSQLPVDLVSNGCAGLRWILKKEIVHAILSGARSRSELQKVKAFVNCPEAILTEQFLQSAISELCEDSLESSDGGPGKLFIKPQFALDFDPEHSHLMPKKQQASFDSANEVRKSLKRDIDKYKGILPTTPWPIISRSSVSSPHKAFGSTRSLLYCKSFADFMKYLVVSILPDASSQTLKAGGQIIIARVIHLITLQLHSQTETASYVRQLHSMPEYEGDSEHHKEVLSFELSVSQQDGGMFSLLETLADVFAKGLIAADEFYHDGLLYVLSEYAKQSAHIREMCKSKGIGLTGLSATTDIHTSASDSLKRRRDEAMSRAMTTMRKRAAQFFQANDMTLPMALSKALTLVESDTTAGDGYDDIEGSTVCKEVLDIEGDEVICIVCREGESALRPCGYLSLVQASKALANVLKYGNDAVNKTEELGLLVSPNSVYRIVSARGAYIMSAPNEKAEIIMTAELGTHVVVSRRLNGSKWVEIESPCAGWCALYASGDNIDILLPPQTGDGCAASDSAVRNPVSESGINTEASTRLASAIGAAWRRQLGNLFSDAVTSPTSEQTKTDAATNTIPILLPIKDLMFNRYGSQKPHISSCGHAMHFSCYDDFFTASISKQMSDAFYEHIMSFDTEFRCPMCNAIGNSLIPDVKFCHSIQSTSEVVASSASCADLWDCNRFPIFSRARSIAEADRSDREVDNRILMLSELIYSLCQDKSPLVKKSPIAPPTSGMKKFDRLLQLQASWTCAAHTLLLATCNRRWELKEVLNNSLEKVQISTNELRIISRLLDINVSASRFVSSNVSCSLHTLIFNSGGHGIEPDDSIDALTEEAFNLPNSIIPSSTFEFSAHRAAFSDLAEKYPDQEAENLWPFLKQPLLSHDLHVIAIAALSNCETGQNNLLHVLQLLCLARLVQIMIEPALAPESILQRSRRLAKAPSYLSTHVFPYSEFLKKARSMCGIIGFVDAVTVQVEQAIRLTIIDLFLPFLEYCYNLLLAYGLAIDLPKALDAKESEFDGAPEYAHFAVLLIHLGLPSLENQLERTISGGEKSIIANHVKMWCAGFQKFYEKIGVITASPYIYLTPKPSSMQQDAISGPSKRVYTTNFFVPEDNAILVKDINVENFMENSELGTESSDENNDDDDDADVAIPDAMDIINLMAEAADDSDEYYDSDDSATERMILAAAGSASAKSGWPYVGVDPAFDFIDQGNKDESQLFSSYLGSISGTHSIFDSQGSPLPVGYFDLSCFSIGYRHVASFIDLPNDFTLLYQKYKLPDNLNGIEERRTTALCLVCGQTLQAGNRASSIQGRSRLAPGECTLHSYSCGAGNSVFFLIEDCKCLLVSGPLQVYAPPIYVTEDGETADVRFSTKPLFLSSKRVQMLKHLYYKQKIASEVSQKRSSETHVIRNNYY